MAPQNRLRHAKLAADLAHLVFEKLAQRLDELEFEVFGQPAHVVVAFDLARKPVFAGFGEACPFHLARGRAAFDDIWVQRSLHQKFSAVDFNRLFLENADELAPDDLALSLGVAHAMQCFKESFFGVDVTDIELEVLSVHVEHALGLAFAQKPVVDEHARELRAQGLMNERRRDRAVHAARKRADRVICAHLFSDRGHLLAQVHAQIPIGLDAADARGKTLQDLFSALGVRDFGVELHRIDASRSVFDDRWALVVAHGRELESGGELSDLVAMAHPHLHAAVEIGHQLACALQRNVRATVLAGFGRNDRSAKNLGDVLHAIADAQHRHAELEYGFFARGARGFFVVNRKWTARQNDALGGKRFDFGVGRVAGENLAVNTKLAQPACDELGELRAEIEDQDARVCHWR